MKLFKTVTLILFLFVGNSLAFGQHTFIKKHESMAKELSSEYGIPAEIILSVAFVETGGGSSKSSVNSKNHFGITGKSKNGSKYKTFDNVKDSYIAFCKLLSNKKYYQKLKGNSNLKEWINAIADAGYSTNPTEWKKRINFVISKYLN